MNDQRLEPECNSEGRRPSDSCLSGTSFKDESAMLLSELNHRVKNQLQLIQSFVRLKKAHASDHELKGVLSDIERYISAVSGVDGEMFITEGTRPVPLGQYLRRLIARFRELFESMARPVYFLVDLEEMEVPARTATSIGLLVNEAITNSCKHAVPQGATEIGLQLLRNGSDAILVISDDGPGFRLEESMDGEAHKGTFLMQRLAERLGTDLILDPQWSGTRYTMNLPLKD